MGEGQLRVDALTGLRTLFAPERAKDFAPLPTPPAMDPAHDPSAGFPVLTPDAEEPAREASLDLFTSGAARGEHEVIANTRRPVATLQELTAEELTSAMGLWRARMGAHAEAAHVHLWVTEGAGSAPTHAELVALPFVPAAIARERERSAAYTTRSQGSDLLGDLVQAEVRLRERLVAYDEECVLLAPYASRVPYQLMVVPRTPTPRFEAPGPLGAALLHRALRALTALLGGSPPLTLWVRTAPRGAEHFCWRVDVLPRLEPLGGLELGTGVHLNTILPERAAAELKPLALDG